MEYKRLGDIATYINGYAFKPEDRGISGLPIIRIQDLTGNSYDLGYYDGTYPERVEINDGDVLISWSASLGVYIWDKGKALLNQHIFKVEFDKCKVNKQYFVFAVQHKIKEMVSKTHGATMKHIVKKDFENTVIPFPSLEKQSEISNVLNIISTIISNRQEELQKLDDLIKARFVEMLNEWNPDYIPLKSFLNDITYGFTNPMPDSMEGPWKITAKDVVNGKINYNTARKTTFEAFSELTPKSKPSIGDVLLTKDGTLGRCAVVETDGLCVNQSVAVLKCNEGIEPKFLAILLQMPEYQKEIIKNAGGGTIKHIYITKVVNMLIAVPNLSQQLNFLSFVEQVDKSKFKPVFL